MKSRKKQSKMKWIKPEKILFGNKTDYKFEASGYSALPLCVGGSSGVSEGECVRGSYPFSTCGPGTAPLD